jgi:hypothetical protein
LQSRGVIKDEYIELNYKIMRGFPGDLTLGVVRPRKPRLAQLTPVIQLTVTLTIYETPERVLILVIGLA